jgi:epoxyqueuosine reductase
MHPTTGPNSPAASLPVAPPGGPDATRLATLAADIKAWGLALGLQQVGIADTDLSLAEARLADWLRLGHQGEMDFMARHGTRRSRPAELTPETLRVISARMDYLPEDQPAMQTHLSDPAAAFVSRYALGRDYHKLLRRRLQRLADRIAAAIGPFGYRVFVDSAPVLEKPLAEKAGLGWIGKHTNLINRQAGSWFFGEIYTDLACRSTRRGGPLRHLPGLYRRLPHPGHRRTLCPRRPTMHLLPHHRA